MRRARAAREGTGGASQLRASIQQLRAKKARTEAAPAPLAPEPSSYTRAPELPEDEDAPVVVGAEALPDEEEQLRKFFPSSFGRVEAPKKKTSQLSKEEVLADRDTRKALEQTKLDQSRVNFVGLDKRTVRVPKQNVQDANDADADADDEDEDEDEDEDGDAKPLLSVFDQHKVPVSNEATLTGHTKAVSALSIDRPGTRLLTGSYDNTVRLYDFQVCV